MVILFCSANLYSSSESTVSGNCTQSTEPPIAGLGLVLVRLG